MSDDYYWDNDGSDGRDEFGMPVVAVHPEPTILDYEWLLLSMESDHAKIIIVRHFGLRGKDAARAAGFSSEWSLYRREHEMKKMLERQREHFVG